MKTVFFTIIGLTLAACGGNDDYEPCAGKDPGDECRLCADDDPDCVETAVIKVCDDQGGCGGVPAED